MTGEVFEHEALRSLDDLEWLAAPNGSSDMARRLEAGDPAFLEAVVARVERGKPLLILLHDRGMLPRIERLTLFCPERCAPLLADLAEDRWVHAIEQAPPSRVLPGAAILRCDLRFADEATEDARNGVVSVIFSRFLVSGRPLRHYNCTFFLPLDLRLDTELESQAEHPACLSVYENRSVERYRVEPPGALLYEYGGPEAIPDADAAHAQAYEFFYTRLQRQLFEIEVAEDSLRSDTDGSIRPITHWRLRSASLHDLRLDLVETRTESGGSERETGVTSASVQDVSLYEYYNGLFLLGIRVEMPDNSHLPQLQHGLDEHHQAPTTENALVREDSDWWHGLVFAPQDRWDGICATQVETWLRYTKTSRLLFASFREQKEERKIARQRLWQGDSLLAERNIDDDFSAVVRHFLKCFFSEMPEGHLSRHRRLGQVADDRMFVQVAYALSGPPPRPDTPEIAEFERLFSYALYVDQRSDGAFSPDGWVYDRKFTQELMTQDLLSRWYGVGTLSGYTNMSSVFMGFGGFFQSPIAAVHVPYIYAKIQILALLFRATLERFDRRIGIATRRLVEEGHRTAAFRDLRRDFILFTNNYWFRHLTPQVQGDEVASRMMRQQDLEGVYELIKDELERADEYAGTRRDQWFQERADKAGWIAGGLAIAAILLTYIGYISDGATQGAGATLVLVAAVGWTLFFALKRPEKQGERQDDEYD